MPWINVEELIREAYQAEDLAQVESYNRTFDQLWDETLPRLLELQDNAGQQAEKERRASHDPAA